jgi:hypothetical protein
MRRCGTRPPHFPVFPEFQKALYLKRYDILCQRLVQEQLYSTACVIAAPRSAINTGEFVEFSEMTNLKTFVSSLAEHIVAEAARDVRKLVNPLLNRQSGFKRLSGDSSCLIGKGFTVSPEVIRIAGDAKLPQFRNHVSVVDSA